MTFASHDSLIHVHKDYDFVHYIIVVEKCIVNMMNVTTQCSTGPIDFEMKKIKCRILIWNDSWKWC